MANPVYIKFVGRLKSTSKEGILAEAQQVRDINLNKSQQEINKEVKDSLSKIDSFARDLGNYPSEEDALNALADLAICANPKIVHAHLTYGGGNMSITMVQSIENDYARQVIYNKAKVFQRGIYFTDASRTAIKYKEDWSCLFGDRLQWNSSENKYVLKQFDLTFNKSVTDPIPTATTSNDGLMSKADKQLLEQIKTKLSL